jgi:hypothetical protein
VKLQTMAISMQEFRRVQFWDCSLLYINDITDNMHNLARLFAEKPGNQ